MNRYRISICRSYIRRWDDLSTSAPTWDIMECRVGWCRIFLEYDLRFSTVDYDLEDYIYIRDVML